MSLRNDCKLSGRSKPAVERPDPSGLISIANVTSLPRRLCSCPPSGMYISERSIRTHYRTKPQSAMTDRPFETLLTRQRPCYTSIAEDVAEATSDEMWKKEAKVSLLRLEVEVHIVSMVIARHRRKWLLSGPLVQSKPAGSGKNPTHKQPIVVPTSHPAF